MSLQMLLRASSMARKEDNKPVSPTLVIGLGGSGKEMLLRFRRLLVEHYGSLSAMPFLQFLHLDTDTTVAAREQYDLKADDDPLYEKIRFNPSERIDLTIDGGTSKYVDHIGNYPHIKRWFQAEGKIADLGDLGAGAGQIRMASRLGFYHAPNHQALTSQLDRVRNVLRDAGNAKRASELGFELDTSSLNVFVLASLAGGTGSGTFLDCGFLLRQFFPEAERIAVLLLPNFFQGYAGADRSRANGYAALAELNHYSFGNSFIANWDGTRSESFRPPPFTHTYLLDSANEANMVIGSSNKEYDIYRMVAEFLFQDFSISSFSGLKRATRINLVNFNLNVYTHNFLNSELLQEQGDGRKAVVGDTYPTRFGSFGLAQIAFPTDRVQSACACRLARRVLEMWEQSLVDDALDRLFLQLIGHSEVSFVQGRHERRDGGGVLDRLDLEDALLWYDRGAGKSFQTLIWERAQNLRIELQASPTGDKAATLARHRSQLDQLLAYEDSESTAEWGQWVRILEENRRSCETTLREALRRRAEAIANDPRLGVALALSLLRELKKLLHNEAYLYLAYFEEGTRHWLEEAQRHAQRLDQLQLDLGRHEKQLLFRTADVERDLEQIAAAHREAADLGAFYGYYNARVMKQAFRRGLQVCQAVDHFLGKDDASGKGLLSEYYQLLVGFQRLKDRLQNKERYFSKIQSSVLTVNLYRDGDVELWYRTWLGEGGEEQETLQQIGHQLLSRVLEVESVTAALGIIQRTPAAEVEERLVSFCKNFLASREEQPDALRLLLDADRFSRGEREEKVRLAYELAKVWAAPPQRGLAHINLAPVSASQRPSMIGVDDSDVVRLEEFRQLIERARGGADSAPQFKTMGQRNRGKIVFYNELAGVPAFYPSSVLAPQGLRDAFERHPEKDELHTDKNRFQFGDLIPKTTDESRRFADSVKAFVLARLLGILVVKELSDRRALQPAIHYSFRKKVPMGVEVIGLGDEQHAVDLLYRDRRPEHQTDRQYLLAEVEDVIGRLTAKRELRLYALFLDFYLNVVYPPREESLSDPGVTVTLVQLSPEYAVLHQVRSHLDRLLPSDEERSQLRLAFEKLRGKPLGEALSYEEYAQALTPFARSAGKIEQRSESAVGIERARYRDALALDSSKLEPNRQAEEPRPTRQTVASASEQAPARRRPCPECGDAIDVRAIYCLGCRRQVAKHLICPNCGERSVPDDLEVCWRCGVALPEKEKKIECPRCFGYTGPESTFPCPSCGYGLAAAPGSIAELSAVAVVPQQVECPSCFEKVMPGPACSVCGGLLG